MITLHPLIYKLRGFGIRGDGNRSAARFGKKKVRETVGCAETMGFEEKGRSIVRETGGCAGNNGLCGKREWNDLGIFVVFYAFLLNGSRIPVVP